MPCPDTHVSGFPRTDQMPWPFKPRCRLIDCPTHVGGAMKPRQPPGNGSSKIHVHQEDMGGWVRVFTNKTATLPDDLPLYLSRPTPDAHDRPHDFRFDADRFQLGREQYCAAPA